MNTKLLRQRAVESLAKEDESFQAALENEQGKIEREGGGAYYTKRDMHPKGEMKLWGFIKPI